ncbi:uncharacterized protein ACB058_019673 [Synchiropus picturatus]
MQSLRVFLNERLTAAAEEILGAVEKTIAMYHEEICRSKDLEIGRLRMQLKLLEEEPREDSDSVDHHLLEQHQLSPPPPPELHHPSSPVLHQQPSGSDPEESQHCEDDCQLLEPPQVKEERQGGEDSFWIDQDPEPMQDLDPNIKEMISSSPSAPTADTNEPPVPFMLYQTFDTEEGRDKPYTCSVCEKRFNNCSHLVAHIRTHTGERPYRCEICSKTFVTTSGLNRHQTIHTEGKHFVCNYCGKSFKWMESLGRHVRSVHRKDNMPVAVN